MRIRRDKWSSGRKGIILFSNGSQADIKASDSVAADKEGWLAVTHYPNGELTYYNYDHILWIRWYD